MDEDMGEEYVTLPFLADEELISISGWKRIAAAFSCVAESTNAEKRDLRIKAKVEDVWNDGYINLSNLRELNVRTLRNELEWPMLLARQFKCNNNASACSLARDRRVVRPRGPPADITTLSSLLTRARLAILV